MVETTLAGVAQAKSTKNATTPIKNVKNLDSRQKALVAILLAVLFGGGISTSMKVALREIPPFALTFFRFLIALLLILPLFLREKPKLNKDLWKVFIISTLATVNIVLFAFGVRLTAASTAQMIHAGIPMIVAILSFLILKMGVSRRTIIGLITGLVGVAIIILSPLINGQGQSKDSLIGNTMVFVSAVSFSLYSVLSKRLQSKHSPVYLLGLYYLNTVIFAFVFSLGDFFANPSWITKVSINSILATLYTGIFGGFFFYFLYQYAIKHGTPVIASVSLYLIPISAFIWAYFLLGERLTAGFVIGGALALIGAYIITTRRKIKQPVVAD